MILKLLNMLWLWGGLPAGFAVVMALNAKKLDNTTSFEYWLLGASNVPIGLFLWFVMHRSASALYLLVFLLSVGLGVAAAVWFLRHYPRMSDRIKSRFSLKTVGERNTRTDVRHMEEHLPATGDAFDPAKHFDLARGVFLGFDEKKEAVFIERKNWPKMPHIMVAGASGTGKGVALGTIGGQWLEQGEAVFFCDPKDDEYGPHVMATSAAKAGVQHHFINLREKVKQFNIFDGASADEIEELFVAGFSLNDTGTAADFYSIADRKWAALIAKDIAADKLTAWQAYQRHNDQLEELCPKFGGKLRELGEVDAANAPADAGISFKDIIDQGGSCYIVGHMRHEKIIRVQKMLLVRLLQIAERRDRLGAAQLRPVGIILDEFKYHISRAALEGLGAARDKGVHVTLAFQSLADLHDCGGLPSEAVEGAVIDNCKIKLSYKVESADTAEWLAKFSGKILVDDESREVESNLALSESLGTKRRISMAERYLIDENMLTRMPAGVAVCYGLGLARFAHICPIKAEKERKNIEVFNAAINEQKELEIYNETKPITRPAIVDNEDDLY